MAKVSSVSDLATKTDLNESVKGSERILRADFSKAVKGSERILRAEISKAVKGSERILRAKISKAVKGSERILRAEILKVEERVENVEESQKRMETTLNKISNQLDGFVGRVDDLTNDNEIGTDQIHELREDAKDHEKRITQLESPAH